MEILDWSDLRPVLIEFTIVSLMLLVLLDSYTIYVEVILVAVFLCMISFRVNFTLINGF